VVELSSALTVKDSGLVGLESLLVGLDGDGDGSNLKSTLEGVDRLLGDGLDTGGLESGGHGGGGGLLGAVSVNGFVGPVLLEEHSVLLGIFAEDGREVTSVASEAESDTVNELLLGEAHEFLSLVEVEALHSAGGRERPARSALTLVLDGGHGALCAPVDGRGEGDVDGGGGALDGVRKRLVSEESLVFGLGPVGHLVVAESVG